MGSNIATPMTVEGFSYTDIMLYPNMAGGLKPSLDKNFEFEVWVEADFQNSGFFTMGLSENTLPLNIEYTLGKKTPASDFNNDLGIVGSGYSGSLKNAISYVNNSLLKMKIVWGVNTKKLTFSYNITGGDSDWVTISDQATGWNLNTTYSLQPYMKIANDTVFTYNGITSTSEAPNQVFVNVVYVRMKYLGEGVGLENPEFTAPTCAITYPSGSEILNGVATILVSALNEVGSIKEVDISFDKSGIWLPCTFNSVNGMWEYQWDTKTYQNKDYIITARALV